jgi:hypothetical protein
MSGYALYLNGTRVAAVAAPNTQYTFTGLNCGAVESFGVSAYDVNLHFSSVTTVSNVVLKQCAQAEAVNKLVSVSSTQRSYYDDGTKLHSVTDSNTLNCLTDRGTGTVQFIDQRVADALPAGPPQPECLSLSRVIGHLVSEARSSQSWVVLSDGSPYGAWHPVASIATYRCLAVMMPLLSADKGEIDSLRGSHGEHEASRATCPPDAPAGFSTTGIDTSSISVSWQASMRATGYSEFRNGSKIATTTSTSYSFTGLACGTGYTLGLQAYDALGNTSPTISITAQTNTCPPPPPAPNPTFATMNDAGGIYWRSAPDWGTAVAQSGSGFYPGTVVSVHCYESGTTVPGSANHMWVQASWVSGPGTGSGWMNEHFINDGASIDQAAAGVPACTSSGGGGGGGGGGGSAVEGAIAWAQGFVGAGDNYNGYCLQFVGDAYANGGGINIGNAATAVAWWNAHSSGQHPGDANPPRGALVFWGATSSNSAGHVGISLGAGNVISSESYPKTTSDPNAVHIFSIAVRNKAGYPYLGWIAPPGVSL